MDSERKKQIREEADKIARERQKIIGAAAWYEVVDQVLTEDERAEIKKRFKEGPGSWSWMDHFFDWYNGEATTHD